MKLHKKLFLILALFSLNIGGVSALESGEIQALALTDNHPSVVVCHEAGVLKAMRIVGVVIMIIKVLVPVIIIVTGIRSLTKAVLTEEDGGLKKQAQLLIVKFIVGAFIFFIPTIIYTIMEVAHGYDKSTSQFTDCGKCLTSIKTCEQLIKKYS